MKKYTLVDGVTIDVPLSFYEWLATIESDVRVHDLTPFELGGLIVALRTDGEANSRAVPPGEAVERVLSRHWVTDTGCKHYEDGSGDNAFSCWCGWTGPRVATVGDGVKTWAEHVAAALSASKPDDASALLKEAYRQGWQDCAEDVLTATHKDAMNEGAQNYLDASIGRDGA